MKDRYYLRIDSDSLEDTSRFTTLADAKASYAKTARELDRFGQRCVASIHMAPTRAETVEYPDYSLFLGPRGGVRCERC